MGKKDTIKVFLRIRPDKDGLRGSTGYEVDHSFESSVIKFHLDRRTRDDFGVNSALEDYAFRFDRIFEPQATQEEVFNMVARDCVSSALDGYNSTIFAYGQTGSGKTFSITGGTASYNDRGIIPRSISMVYEEIARRTDFQWTVRVSYLQIYNDRGQDLLNHGEDAQRLEDLPNVTVHETDEEIVMRGLEAHPSASARDALQLLFLGDTNRLYCETPMNASSSRSHCVFTILLEARQHGSATVRTSKLNLVDLAGSERVAKTGVEGTLLQEAKYINISLHYLEHVIVALAEQSQGRREHIPFRNSMMTMALRDSLGGNCRTAMLATGHPGERFLMETVSTCKFAQRVACIKQNARVNEVTDPAVLVKKLQREVAALKDKVAFLDKGEQKVDRELSADELERCREVVARYVADPDPAAQLAGIGGDLARLLACVAIMKGMLVSKGGVPPGFAAAPAAAAGTPPASPAPPGAVQGAPETAKLKEELNRMALSLQEKENELTLMFSIVEKHSAAKFNAATQTTDADVARAMGAGGSALAGGVGDRPADHFYNPARSGAGGIQPQPQPQPQPSREQVLADAQAEVQHAHLQSDYNIDALTDADLLRDRHVAFEAFRRSYRKHEQIERNKSDLKAMYDRCEAGGRALQELQSTLKRLKAKVQQLRTERALQCVEEPDAEERALMEQLSATRQEFHERAKSLEKERERVEHMHLVMKRTQEQLIKDFEEWFSLRQRQVAMAQQYPQQQQQQQQQQQRFEGPAGGRAAVLVRASPSTPPSALPPLNSPLAQQRHPQHPSSADAQQRQQQPQHPSSADAQQRQQQPQPPSSADAQQRQQLPQTQPSSSSLISGSIMGRLAGGVAPPPSGMGQPQPQPRAAFAAPPSSVAPQHAGLARSSSGAAFVEEQHRAMRADDQQHAARLRGSDPVAVAANPYAPQYRSTGNAAADAELARMYRARDELRSQLSSGDSAAGGGTSPLPQPR